MELYDRIIITWQEANRMSSKTMAPNSPCLKKKLLKNMKADRVMIWCSSKNPAWYYTHQSLNC